jgi:hypothetical protein
VGIGGRHGVRNDKSWDVQDRLTLVKEKSEDVLPSSGKSLLPAGERLGLETK